MERLRVDEEGLWRMARGFQPSRILLTAVEMGVFAALGNGPKTSLEVATELKANERATDRLMNALVALGLLITEGGFFINSEEVNEYLVPGKPDYMGAALMHTANMWDSWSTLTDAVKVGTSLLKREGKSRQQWIESFISAMHYNATRRAREVVSIIDLTGLYRLLDVGGGSGAYSIAFCRAKPDLEAVVFELPDVVPLTKQYIEEAGMIERIKVVAGDYLEDELGSGFDMAFLSSVIHSNRPKENQELFNKCWRALSPGGMIAIQDFIMDPNRTTPPHGAIFALNMLVATPGGDTYTEEEITEWLRAASFEEPRRLDPFSGVTAILMSWKQ